MFKKIKEFLIKNKVIGEFEGKIKVIIPDDKSNYQGKIEFYNEKFPIAEIIPKSLVKINKEKIFTIKWNTNKNNTVVFLIIKKDKKEIIHKSIILKHNETKEIKI